LGRADSAGGVAISTIVTSRGLLQVFSAGVASNAVVQSGGALVVSSGGVASGTTIDDGGSETISSGGTDFAATVSGGYEYVSSGGSATDTTIGSSGTVTVYDGGVLSGNVTDNGSVIYNLSGGDSFAGTLTGTGSLTVEGGGTLVMSGGDAFAGNVVISSGSTLELSSAGAAGTGPIIFDSGGSQETLRIDGTTMPTNVISGFALGDVVDMPNVAPNSPISATYSLANGSNNATLSLSNGMNLSITGPDPVPTFGFVPDDDGQGGTDLVTVSVQNLLDLAFDTYSLVPAGTVGYSLLMTAPADHGFEADAYIDRSVNGTAPDIVIAFRGSSSDNWFTTIYNYIDADSTFVTGVLGSNSVLAEYVSDAASFVSQVYTLGSAK
jgi:autotransporter passenger strand-loop-strand repeat protein